MYYPPNHAAPTDEVIAVAEALRASGGLYVTHMRDEGDPLAWVALGFIRLYGWVFFNYHGRPWRGQLVRKIFRNY